MMAPVSAPNSRKPAGRQAEPFTGRLDDRSLDHLVDLLLTVRGLQAKLVEFEAAIKDEISRREEPA
jgi:hypothetical protein